MNIGYRVIRKASSIVMNLCGEQMYESRKQYRISNFTFTIYLNSVALYYSCLTGELLEVTNLEAAYSYMVSHWFYVTENYDEKKDAPKLKRLMVAMGKTARFGYKHFEILTTTDCNARCFYCYEKGFKFMTMEEDTAKQVVNFINNHKLDQKIKLRWYGGEPLLNTEAIDIITDGLSEHRISFSSSIITNGYLFTDELVKKAREKWILKKARITIDGNEKTYNRIKNYKNISGNAFIRVMDNIKMLINGGIKVTVRVNIEKHNVDEIVDLLDKLCNLYNSDEIDYMISPLNNTTSCKTLESTLTNREYIINKVQCIKYELFDKGYNINSGELPGLNPYTCLADNGRYLLIKPNGEIAFCSEDFNVQRYGSIFYAPTKIIPPKLYENTIEKGYICSDCPLYPSCYPSKLCPACKHPICDEMQKNAILADLGLSIRKEYRKFLKTNML